MITTKKTLSFISGFACFCLIFFMLTGYENKKMHGTFNDAMREAFLNKIASGVLASPDFKHYIFDLGGDKISGMAVTNPGYTPQTYGESEVSKTPAEWINHGGYSADEPEVPAGLRHFWEPINGGETGGYLTDRGTYWEGMANNMLFNPNINAMQWALYHGDNKWRFDEAKQAMLDALTASSETERKALMAKSYRALGETLHLIADMGCPPHVRNDSHASISTWEYSYGLGDPDPYEDLVKPSNVAAYTSTTAGGPFVVDFLEGFKNAILAQYIFLDMASFTSLNFYSNDTIMGFSTDGKSIDPVNKNPLPSPQLEELRYDPKDYTYYLDIPGGGSVKMAKDKSMLWSHAYPYVDADIVKSQAAMLMPIIVEAGANIMRLYFPLLSVEITNSDAGVGMVEGTITHTADSEYTSSQLSLQPEVALYVNNNKIATTQAVDGHFSFTGQSFSENDQIFAELRMPGFSVRSEASGSAPGDFPVNDVVFSLGVGTGVTKDACGEEFSSTPWTVADFAGEAEKNGSSYIFTDDFIAEGTSLTVTLDNSSTPKSLSFTYFTDDGWGDCTDTTKVTGTVPMSDFYENEARIQATYELLGVPACEGITSIEANSSCRGDCDPVTFASYECENVMYGGIIRIVIYGYYD